MDFFDKTGRVALGSRLRMLTDRITADDAVIYEKYGIDTKPKWFPVLFTLSEDGPQTITGIAREIGHSHPSVSNIVKEMAAKGYVKEVSDAGDRRRTVIALSAKGKRLAAQVRDCCRDVQTAVDNIFSESCHDLWRAVMEWEELLSERSLAERVFDVRKAREAGDIEIVPYDESFREVFRDLNTEWISAYFEIEDADRRMLEDPKEYIIDKGGQILVGLFRGEPVGVCALCRTDDPVYDYELAKFAVSPKAQGRGVGMRLCQAIVERARQIGAERLFIESNTSLKPALHIYRKVGFREIPLRQTPYKRADIFLEMALK